MSNELFDQIAAQLLKDQNENVCQPTRLVSLLQAFAENADLAVLHYNTYGFEPLDAAFVCQNLERTIDEIKTIVGNDPPSTGSRRDSVCNDYAVGMLCRNPGTRSLLGCDLDAKAPAGAGLGDEGNAT